MLLFPNLIVLLLVMGFFGFLIVQIAISRFKKITTSGVLVFSTTLGIVFASGYAESRLREKLYHIESIADWDFVVKNTWEAFPSVLIAYCLVCVVIFGICYKLSKLSGKV